jgi:5-methylcytosine-specific restriction endonuclease McrA
MYTSSVNGRVYGKGDLIVDHLVPRRLLKTSAEQYDVSNLWLLTMSQHRHKTAIETKMSDEQLKHISREWWKKVLKD